MDYPFTTDGCSGGMSAAWRAIASAAPPWEGACVDHDKLYWKGGTAKNRRDADRRLRVRVAGCGHPLIAWVMWLCVRIGGHPLLPAPWRWGYGWKYPHFYKRG